jgi:hypothetical protein
MAQIGVLDLRSRERKLLIRGSHAEYVATGHLVYLASGTLHAVRFDPNRLEVLGDPLPVVGNITSGGPGDYAVSDLGTLVLVPGGADRSPRSLVWVDRKGRETPLGAPLRAYIDVQLSPDGTRVAVTIRDQDNDIYIWNLAGGPLRRLTFEPSNDRSPVWTPDNQRILFASNREGMPGLFSRAADGTGEIERLASGPLTPTSVTPDGAAVLGWELNPTTAGNVFRAPLVEIRPSSSGRVAKRYDLIDSGIVGADLVHRNQPGRFPERAVCGVPVECRGW